MSEAEFDIIERYFAPLQSRGARPDWLVTGIGDDAAILQPQVGFQSLISVDTLNVGVHFLPETPPFDVACKALAVNLSDIAAMGGEPLWFTLALSLPQIEHDCLQGFADGLATMMQTYSVQLIGGDTTQGPLSITIQIAGQVPTGQAIMRAGAKPGDNIYVTGSIGDAAAALQLLRGPDAHRIEPTLIERLQRPTPRVATGMALRQIATSCIDISDGLAGDLGHILAASKVAAEIDLSLLPQSNALQQAVPDMSARVQHQLFGGDDYELCFTAGESERPKIEDIARQQELLITRIGRIVSGIGLYEVNGTQRRSIAPKGYEHFRTP